MPKKTGTTKSATKSAKRVTTKAKTTKVNNDTYDARSIEVLEGLEGIRRLPGMYIGGTDERALHHLVYEILSNSADEIAGGHASAITLTVIVPLAALAGEDGELRTSRLPVGTWIVVTDDGRGIPVDPHPKSHEPALTTIMTSIHSGGKIGRKGSYKYAGGIHGVGLAVVNALSSDLVVLVKRDGYLWGQAFQRGIPITPLQRGYTLRTLHSRIHNSSSPSLLSPLTLFPNTSETGTLVAFRYDETIFRGDNDVRYSLEWLREMVRRTAYRLSGLSGLSETSGDAAGTVKFPAQVDMRLLLLVDSANTDKSSTKKQKRREKDDDLLMHWLLSTLERSGRGGDSKEEEPTPPFSLLPVRHERYLFTGDAWGEMNGDVLNTYPHYLCPTNELANNLSEDNNLSANEGKEESAKAKTKKSNSRRRRTMNALPPNLYAAPVSLPSPLDEGRTAAQSAPVFALAYEGGDNEKEAVSGLSSGLVCLAGNSLAGNGLMAGGSGELAPCRLTGEEEKIRSYVNGIHTPDGGDHLSGLRAAIARAILFAAKKEAKRKYAAMRSDDIHAVLRGVLAVTVLAPSFRGQTKQALAQPEVRRSIQSIVYTAVTKRLKEDDEFRKGILDAVFAETRRRMASRSTSRRMNEARSGNNLPIKLADISWEQAQGETELFIVEGDSAGGSAKQARDRRFQAILPLRGKVLNAAKATRQRVLANATLREIRAAVFSETNPTEPRYDRIIIMADADPDGAHIRALLITYFVLYHPELVRAGRLYSAVPPLYRISPVKGKRQKDEGTIYLYTEEEMDRWSADKDEDELRRYTIQRYKGLGEMNPEQLWETTMNPAQRRLWRIVLVDEEEGKEEVSRAKASEGERKRRKGTRKVSSGKESIAAKRIRVLMSGGEVLFL